MALRDTDGPRITQRSLFLGSLSINYRQDRSLTNIIKALNHTLLE